MTQRFDVKAVYEQFHAQRTGSAEQLGWNSTKDQQVNFTTMLDEVQKLGVQLSDCTVHDAGCGHGDLHDVLVARGGVKGYIGTDFVATTLATAREQRPGLDFRQLDLLTGAAPKADLTLCFGALAFHQPREVEALLHKLWSASAKGLGFISWWDLTPDYVYFREAEKLRKCVRRFMREARPRATAERIGDFAMPVEALFVLVK